MNITTVQVYDRWNPAGMAGDNVQISVAQTLGNAQNKADLLTSTGASTVYLKLDSPQTAVAPADVAGVYPAGGSTTSPSEYLPHVAIKRYTLPWERVGPAPDVPWLAVILFKASDLPLQIAQLPLTPVLGLATSEKLTVTREAVSTGPPISTHPAPDPNPAPTGTTLLQCTVSQIQSADPIGYKQLTDAAGCNIDPSTSVNALYLPNSVWTTIQPHLEELALLCHVRKGSDGSKTAIVIGNRLPSPPAQAGADPEPHTAVLVSLEKRSDLFGANNKRTAGATVALLGLYQWTFTPSKGLDFADAIQAIRYKGNGGVLRFGNVPAPPPQGASAPLTAGFDALVGSDAYLRTPLETSGGGTGSYRGPLHPFATPPRENTFAVHSAPEAFASAPVGTPPDYSYASAFELGRLMALSDSGIVEDLRGVHGVIDLPKQFVNTQVPLPPALALKEWGPDPAQEPWVQEPWSGAVGEPAAPATADVTGVAQQVAGWVNSIGAAIQGVTIQTTGEAGGAVAVDIGAVDAASLGTIFADVIAAAD